MVEQEITAASCLVQAEYLERTGDYVGAIRAVHQGLCVEPQNTALQKKREELLAVICWRC